MADISVKLNGDNSNFKRMMDDSSQAAGTIAGQIAKKFELKDIGKTMATALGLNIQNMAEQVARFFTGVTKEEEEAYKKLEQLSTQATDAAIKNMRATLTEEQRYQLALKEREKLQRDIDSSSAKTAVEQVAIKEKQIKLEEKIAEIIAYEKKQTDALAKSYETSQQQRVQDAASIYSDSLKQLTIEEKIVALKSQIASTQYLIRTGAFDAVTQAQQEKVLQQQKNELVKTEYELRKDVGKALDSFFAPLEKQSIEERNRLEKQKQITAELEKQKQVVSETIVETEKLNAVTKVMIGYNQEDVTQMSGAELSAYQRKLKGNVSDIEQRYRGGTVGSAEYDLGANLYRKTLKDIEAEQRLRNQFSQQSSVYSEAQLRDKYDTYTFDRLKQLFNPDLQNRQANILENIDKNFRILIGG